MAWNCVDDLKLTQHFAGQGFFFSHAFLLPKYLNDYFFIIIKMY